ncbi:MAG: cell envelope integrity protein TolA [Burkholderiaceae bacterium]
MDSRPTSAAGRDPFMPQPPKVRGRAITLAVLAHVLLLLAIAFGVNWRSSEPTTVAAELWSATPQAVAPRAVEPTPTPPPTPPPEVRKPEPVAKPPEPVAPPKPSPALPDPQIAIEKARREEAKRAAAEQEQQKAKRERLEREKVERAEAERQKRAKDELAQKKAAAEKAEKLKAEKAEQAEAARQAAARDDYLKRMQQGLPGATGGPGDTGTALRSSAPSASYAGRIMARIKPNIVFTDLIDGNPMATVEVRLAPDGTIVAKRLVKSSGVKSWDDAVLRAIERTEVLPRDVDGRVPPPFQIDFRPRD